MSATVSKEATDVEKVAQQAAYSPLMETLTRIGYAVRGLIYITMGLLAIQFVMGNGGELASPKDAIANIGGQPAGLILLWIVLIGLVSYSLWGVIRAALDPFHKGHDLKGLLLRFGYLVSAFGYAVLVLPTYYYIIGASQHADGDQTQKFISMIMDMPWGRWVIGAVGLGVIAGGLYHIYMGIEPHFERQFQVYELTPEQVKLATYIGRFGTSARGLIFALVGNLIILSAYRANPNQSVSQDSALAALMPQPFGIWLLGIVALGLIAFGIYSLISAVWFRHKKMDRGES